MASLARTGSWRASRISAALAFNTARRASVFGNHRMTRSIFSNRSSAASPCSTAELVPTGLSIVRSKRRARTLPRCNAQTMGAIRRFLPRQPLASHRNVQNQFNDRLMRFSLIQREAILILQ